MVVCPLNSPKARFGAVWKLRFVNARRANIALEDIDEDSLIEDPAELASPERLECY